MVCFDISLSPIALTGDIYLNGNIIVTGMNASQLSLSPNTAYLIEIRNIQDSTTPGFGDLFIYPNQSQTIRSAFSGQVRPIMFRPLKQYVKGILELTCDPRGRKATDNIACRPTIDGVIQADVAAGTKVTYHLVPGAHTVQTELVGDQANHWSLSTRDDIVTINVGKAYIQTVYLRTSFTLKGLFKIVIFPKGVVADLYLNGVPLISQSPALDIYVAPGTHTIEARAVTDPAANGMYSYPDISKSATAFAGGTRWVYLYPVKTWLVGFLKLTCQINRKGVGDDVRCLVNSDGVDLGTVEAGQKATFNLTPGPHVINITTSGASAGNWDGPVSTTVNIVGGRTVYSSARFNPRPQPAPTSIPALDLTENEKLAQGTHYYFIAYKCTDRWWTSNTDLTIEFQNSDTMTLNTNDQHIGNHRTYSRQDKDVWVTNLASDLGRSEHILSFGQSGFTLRFKIIGNDGNEFYKCDIDWLRTEK